MKKIFLMISVISAVLSFSETSGNFKISTEPIVNLKYYGETGVIVNNNIDLGVYFDKSKDNYIFASGKLNSNSNKNDLDILGFAGIVSKVELDKDTNLLITNIYSKPDEPVYNYGTEIYDRVEMERKIHDYLKLNEEKIENLKEMGYVLNKDDTILLSTVFRGKFGDTNYRISGIYNSKNFDENTHKLDTEIEIKSKLKKSDISAKLTYQLGQNAKYDIHGNYGKRLRVELYDANLIFNNTNQGGRLLGDFKVSSDNLAKGLNLYTRTKFDLGTILPETIGTFKNQGFKINLNNGFKYKVNDIIDVYANLNYETRVVSKKEDFVEKGMITHLPEGIIGINYKEKNLKASLEIENGYKIDKYFEKPDYLSKDIEVDALLNIKGEIKYNFDEKNSLRLKVIDKYMTDESYKDEPNTLKDTTRVYENNNRFVAGFEWEAKNEIGKSVLENSLSLIYDQRAYSKIKQVYYKGIEGHGPNPLEHYIKFISKNNIKSNITKKLNIESNLDLYLDSSIIKMARFQGTSNKKYEENFATKEATYVLDDKNTITFNGILVGDLIFNYENKDLNYKNKTEIFLTPRIFESKFDKLNYGIRNISDLNYDINKNFTLNTGLKLEIVEGSYDSIIKQILSYNKMDYLEKTDLSYRWYEPSIIFKEPEKLIMTYNDEFYKNSNNIIIDSNGHNIIIQPKIGVTYKMFNDKLVVKPYIVSRFSFGKINTMQEQKFGLYRFDVKANLGLEYNW